jgi:hypothetical protein
MRTKTLLLTAALSAAGALTSMAQVYSINIVGYVNLSIPQGFSMIANQLNNSANNQLATLIPTPPNASFFYKFSNTSGAYSIDDYTDGAWEGDTSGTMTMNPGEGLFVFAPSAFTATFVGEVQLSSTTPVPHGFSIVSSAIPQQGLLDTDLAYPSQGATPGNAEFFYQFQNSVGAYRINDFTDGAWEGDDGGSAPTIHVGEAFWIFNPNAATAWSRTFTVGS